MSGRTAFLSRALRVFLTTVERGGNALPHPGTLFAILAGVIVLVSAIAARTGIEVVHPGTGELIQPVSLATVAGLHRILTEMVTNFTSFAPLGTVLVSMLGIGVLESSGLIGAGLRLLVLSAPKHLLTFVIVLAGVLSNTASEIGYVLLVPLGGIIFLGAGRHPIAGLAAAFAGVSGGYSANLLLGTVDPLLAGLSEEAARIVDDGYRVNPAANYYFMVVSTFVIATAGTWVTERIVIPRLGAYEGDGTSDEPNVLRELSSLERRGLVTLGHASLEGAGPVAPDLTLSGLTTIRAGDEDFLVTVPDAFAPGEPRGTRLEAPLAQIVIWRFDVLHVEPLDLHLDAGLHPPAPEVTGVEARITPHRKGLQTTTLCQFTVRVRQEAVKEPIGHVLSLVDDAGGRVYGNRLVPETTHSRQRGRRYRKPFE